MNADPAHGPTSTQTPAASSPAAEAVPVAVSGPHGDGPVFLAGADRSGTTLLFALLASHPRISMVRRTNMWRYFYRRYGDLSEPANLDRCLQDMLRYRRMWHLDPDVERIRREFLEGPPTYGRLFSLFHQHNAERNRKRRWGDKSLHTEHYAEDVLAELPDARIVQIVRDPRDRYASVRKRHGQDLSRVGAATGRWLMSTRAGRRNQRRHPDRYLMVRYEDVAREPEATLRRVCAFIGETYSPAMLSMSGVPEHRDGGDNSSFGDLERGAISTQGIGRYRTVLSPSELAFIQLFAGRDLVALGYEPTGAILSSGLRLRFLAWDLPIQTARMLGWMALARLRMWRGSRAPGFRMTGKPEPAEPPVGEPGTEGRDAT